MAKVYRRPGEPFEMMLSRFRGKVAKDGVLREALDKGEFQKPGEKARRKSMEARRRKVK